MERSLRTDRDQQVGRDRVGEHVLAMTAGTVRTVLPPSLVLQLAHLQATTLPPLIGRLACLGRSGWRVATSRGGGSDGWCGCRGIEGRCFRVTACLPQPEQERPARSVLPFDVKAILLFLRSSIASLRAGPGGSCPHCDPSHRDKLPRSCPSPARADTMPACPSRDGRHRPSA